MGSTLFGNLQNSHGDVDIVYRIILTGGYHTSLAKTLKRDVRLQNPIDEALQSLYDDPYYKTKLVQGEKGIRRVKVGNTAYRLIFCIVEECERSGNARNNGCSLQQRKDVIVWLVYQRKKDYLKLRKGINFDI